MLVTKWLERFEQSWKDKNTNAILELFSDKVEYWETSFKKLASKDAIAEEWQVVHEQENIAINTSLFASEGNKHAVTWELAYGRRGKQHAWRGTYLLELNNEGKCVYFYQTGETS